MHKFNLYTLCLSCIFLIAVQEASMPDPLIADTGSTFLNFKIIMETIIKKLYFAWILSKCL